MCSIQDVSIIVSGNIESDAPLLASADAIGYSQINIFAGGSYIKPSYFCIVEKVTIYSMQPLAQEK